MATAGVKVEGLREVRRGFKAVSSDVAKQLTRELRDIGETVRVLAEEKASSDIPHIGARWSRMRVGVTASYVYIAPKSRRAGGSPRKNLAGLLVQRAMVPAAEESREATVVKVEGMLDRITTQQF